MIRWLLPLLVGATTPAQAAAPRSDTLQITTTPLTILNPTLGIDDGSITSFADKTPGNHHPDGWRTKVRKGSLTVTRNTPHTVRFAYSAGTTGHLRSTEIPVRPGETLVMDTRLRAPKGTPPSGSFGIAFGNEHGVADYANRRLESTDGEWRDIHIRATAPRDATRAFVRWIIDSDRDGAFEVTPVTVRRVTAESRSVAFDVRRVFLVTIETFDVDHASIYGYERETTPNLARMAAEGALFTRHYVQAPFTRPSLSSLVTSRYPTALGVTDNVTILDDSVTTVAERFASAGYVTGGFLAQYILAQHYGFNQGFHTFRNYKNDTAAGVVFDDLMPWLASHQRDNLFLWLHLFDPHGPYRPVDGWVNRYENDAIWAADTQQLTPGKGKTTGPFIPEYVFDAGHTNRRWYVSNYDSEITYTDQKLGELLDSLRNSGLDEQSIVVVTADHGESMTEHDRYFCHGSLYDHDLRVPLIIWAPGRINPGTIVTERTAHLDLVPTLLDYAGVAVPPELMGASLRGVINGSSAPEPFTMSSIGAGDRHLIAVVADGEKKLVLDQHYRVLEYYDLALDPREMRNLASSKKSEADRIARDFSTWYEGVLALDRPVEVQERELSKEEIEQLRALGYME
jgi:arylsulfatase A-like enzyme